MSDPYMARYLEWRLTHPPMMGGSDEAESEEAAAETTEPAEAAAEATTVPPPWGDDFQPERAWNTIQKQRARELELEAEAKQLKALREDPQAQREFLESLGYEIPADEPEQDDEDDPIAPLRNDVESVKAWKEQQEQREALALFKSDVDKLAEGSEVSLKEKDYASIYRDAEALAASGKRPFDDKVVKEVFDAMVADRKAMRDEIIAEYTGSKKTPPVLGSSNGATQTPDLDDRKSRNEWLREQERARMRS